MNTNKNISYAMLALAVGIAGAFLAVATYAFAAPAAVTLAFAVSIGVLVAGGLMTTAAVDRESPVFSVIGAVIGLVAAWTIVATLVFPIGTALWLGFASALAYGGLAIVAIATHELTTERVVHHLSVNGDAMAKSRDKHVGAAAA